MSQLPLRLVRELPSSQLDYRRKSVEVISDGEEIRLLDEPLADHKELVMTFVLNREDLAALFTFAREHGLLADAASSKGVSRAISQTK